MKRKKRNKITYTPDGGNVLRGIERFNKATSADVTGVGTSGATSAGGEACCEDYESNVRSIVYNILKGSSNDRYLVYMDLPEETIAQEYPGVVGPDGEFGPFVFSTEEEAKEFVEQHKQRPQAKVPVAPEVATVEYDEASDGSPEYMGRTISATVTFVYKCPNCGTYVDLPNDVDYSDEHPIYSNDSKRMYACSTCGQFMDLAGIHYWEEADEYREANYREMNKYFKSNDRRVINVREELNKLDRVTGNEFDLLNLYEALPSTSPVTQQNLKAIAQDLTTGVSTNRELAAKMAARLTQMAGGDPQAITVAVQDGKRLLDREATEIKSAAQKNKTGAKPTQQMTPQQAENQAKFTESCDGCKRTQECSCCISASELKAII